MATRDVGGWAHAAAMATRESRVTRGRRRGNDLLSRTLEELRRRRILLGISQYAMGSAPGWPQTKVWRTEARKETRIRDIQALVRRIRLRERDGGVDTIVIVLADSSANRRLAGALREALGADYETSPRQVMSALRAGQPLPASGVVLL
jgi:hypothetical protein